MATVSAAKAVHLPVSDVAVDGTSDDVQPLTSPPCHHAGSSLPTASIHGVPRGITRPAPCAPRSPFENFCRVTPVADSPVLGACRGALLCLVVLRASARRTTPGNGRPGMCIRKFSMPSLGCPSPLRRTVLRAELQMTGPFALVLILLRPCASTPRWQWTADNRTYGMDGPGMDGKRKAVGRAKSYPRGATAEGCGGLRRQGMPRCFHRFGCHLNFEVL